MLLSDKIRAAIQQSGQSVYRVALSAKVEEKTLRRFMRRDVGLSMAALDRLSSYLGLTVSPTQEALIGEATDVSPV